MQGRFPFPCLITRFTAAFLSPLVMAVILSGLAPHPAPAQTRDGFAQDVVFKVINATDGRPGTLDRLTIDYLTERPNTIIDIHPDRSAFTVPAVPLRDAGEYIVTAMWQDVPYWFSFRGSAMVPDTLTLHVFDAVAARDGVRVEGLNIVAQKRGELLTLEYMLKIDNANNPQRTVLDPAGTVILTAPAGATDPEANYRRGPAPTAVPARLGAGSLALAAPLTWGQNTLRVTLSAPWSEGMVLPVGLNLPVDSWSLLLSPESLAAKADGGLDFDPTADLSGFRRYRGRPLDAGDRIEVTLTGGGSVGTARTNLFGAAGDTQAIGTESEARESDSWGARVPVGLILVLALAGLILLLVANRRARS